MKIGKTIAMIGTMCLVTVAPVLAVSSSVSSSLASSVSSSITTSANYSKNVDDALKAYKAASTAQKLAKCKDLGTKIVDERVDFLTNKLLTKIEADKNLLDEQKTDLTQMIQDNLERLNAQKTAIGETTTPVNCKTEIKKVYTDFRIYMVFAPKIHGLLQAYDLKNLLETKLNTILDKLQTKLDDLDSKGVDITNMQAKLTDAKNQYDNALAAVNSAVDEFNSMLPAADTTAAKAAYERGKNKLKDAKTDLQNFKKDLTDISNLLKAVHSTTSSALKTSAVSSAATSSN